MPEPLLRDLGMHASGEQVRRVAVPQIVEADARDTLHAADQVGELVRKAAGLVWLAIRPRARERVPC